MVIHIGFLPSPLPGFGVPIFSWFLGLLLVTFISRFAASHYKLPDPNRRLAIGHRDLLTRLAAYAGVKVKIVADGIDLHEHPGAVSGKHGIPDRV
jgi:hypothetical protein